MYKMLIYQCTEAIRLGDYANNANNCLCEIQILEKCRAVLTVFDGALALTIQLALTDTFAKSKLRDAAAMMPNIYHINTSK
jgi:hypothetical protein